MQTMFLVCLPSLIQNNNTMSVWYCLHKYDKLFLAKNTFEPHQKCALVLFSVSFLQCPEERKQKTIIVNGFMERLSFIKTNKKER